MLFTPRRARRLNPSIEKLARAGYAIKGIVYALVGVFGSGDATTGTKTTGTKGTTTSLADESFGPYLLGVVALGLVAYGAYCVLNARYRTIG